MLVSSRHQHQHIANGTMTGEEALGLAIVLGSSFSIVGVVFSFITYRWVRAEASSNLFTVTTNMWVLTDAAGSNILFGIRSSVWSRRISSSQGAMQR